MKLDMARKVRELEERYYQENQDLHKKVHDLENRLASNQVADELDFYKSENAHLVSVLTEIADGRGKYASLAAEAIGRK